MKKIYFYLLASLVMVSSCVKQMDEPDDLPIAGKWAQVDSDGSVSKYVSFEGGKFYEYKASSKHYYLNENIWHAGNNDYARTQEAWYSARNGSLTYGGNAYDISVSDGVLKIGNTEYLPLESLKSEYGFALTHDIPINANKVAEYSAAAQEVVWNYQIKDLPKGYKLTASATCLWIRSVQVTENQIKLTLEENPTMTTRSVEVTLKHPAVLDLRFTLQQNNAGPKLSSMSTSATYASEVFEVPYTIENPRDDVELIATSEVSWITDLSVKNDKLTFKVLENNSGSSRSSDIVLTYGSVTVNHKVTQSYSAPSLTLSSSSTSCGYAASSQSFTYTLSNPREGQSVKVSCSASWITNLVHSGTSVSFKISENNSGSSRTGNIVLTYSDVSVSHKVVQTPLQYADLSSSETANCYIVSESGAYKFKTVKGNSTTSVGTASSAVVLWETFGTSTTPNVGALIKSVSYKDGYIAFQTADTFKEGNAVIAAKNSSGTILWSWHIWLTDQPQGQVYYNNAGTMMDRNLGATSATPGDVGALGLLYQWGRKDPFLNSSSIHYDTMVEAKSTITWPSAVSSNSNNGTIAYATANPTTFIKYNSSNYDWYYTGYSSTDNTRWTTSDKAKSIYDPCPAGWRVPDGGENGVWSKAVGSSRGIDGYPYDSTNKGMNFSRKFGADQTIWYPASGYRSYRDGGLYGVGYYGYYWSASPIDIYAYLLYFYSDGGEDSSLNTNRASCESVRCLQE